MDWQPIETAPKDGTVILIVGEVNYQRCITEAYFEEKYLSWESDYPGIEMDGSSLIMNPTHWAARIYPPAQQ